MPTDPEEFVRKHLALSVPDSHQFKEMRESHARLEKDMANLNVKMTMVEEMLVKMKEHFVPAREYHARIEPDAALELSMNEDETSMISVGMSEISMENNAPSGNCILLEEETEAEREEEEDSILQLDSFQRPLSPIVEKHEIVFGDIRREEVDEAFASKLAGVSEDDMDSNEHASDESQIDQMPSKPDEDGANSKETEITTEDSEQKSTTTEESDSDDGEATIAPREEIVPQIRYTMPYRRRYVLDDDDETSFLLSMS